MKRVIFGFLPLLLCQCASIEKSVGLGIGIGAAGGIAASQLAHYNPKGHAVLALSGAVIGGIVGALLYKKPPDSPQLPPSIFPKDSQPPLVDAEKDVILVPDKIEGEHFVEKHRIWTIKKPARWQLRNKDGSIEKEEENDE